MSGTPVFVMNTAPERQSGRKAQISNITAAKTVADVIRTCLGPKAMLKMILDPMGGILLTNDGNAILREIDVAHPAAKNMIELSRTQDEECGDGTTSVIVLAASILASSLSQLERDIHPVVIISAYNKALREALAIIEKVAIPVNVEDEEQMLGIVKGALGTKFVSRWSELMCKLALDAVHIVAQNVQSDKSDSQYASTFSSATPTVDIKRYARIEKIPGGAIEESRVIRGIMLNKDITHPGSITPTTYGKEGTKESTITGVETGPFLAVAEAMEVIPRTLVQNAGGNAIRVLTELRAKHTSSLSSFGVNGDTGKIVDMKEYGLWESASVKVQILKTAVEAARMLLRVDDVVQAVRKDREPGSGAPMPEEMMEAQ
ncbi:T-complex protein 1 [Lentinula edodes]|uniref:T-complex protein 1 subunit gamma n=1 Tax=Lentinula edodes TaxID=5353 RepID=A0A1Q3EDG4_LENED|nr:T-complex protein 1 [Lentinula edodes]